MPASHPPDLRTDKPVPLSASFSNISFNCLIGIHIHTFMPGHSITGQDAASSVVGDEVVRDAAGQLTQ
jgi:hypothetical protein